MNPATPANRGHEPGIGFGDRLLAEAVRALERDGAQPIDDPRAEAEAAGAGGDFEQRVAIRARSLDASRGLGEALVQTRQVIGVIMAVGMLLAAVAGAGAARASLATADDAPVNIYWALGGLLGIQTLLLAVWIVMMIKGPSALAGASLGGAVFSVGRRLSGRWHKGRAHEAAIEATGVVMARGGMGRWMLSAISHGLWVVFNVMCLLLLVLMLSARHYRFVWETTILSADAYTSLTHGIAWGPAKLGFPTPTPQQISASDGSLPPTALPLDQIESARHAWSGLLIGSLVTYGLGPRVILLGLCLRLLRGARRRWRLDTNRPGYLRLQPRLMPQTESLGVIDPDTPGVDEADAPTAPGPQRAPTGPPAVLGLEIDAPASPWPPKVAGVSWRDLGLVDDRLDRQRALEQLAEPEAGPATVVIVCGLTTTPDRGHVAFIEQVRQASRSPVALVLTGGEAFRQRGDGGQLAGRIEDWRTLANDAGVSAEQVIELDLDHLTDTSISGLAELVGADPGAPPGARRIESAFDLIVDHLDRWKGDPDDKQRAALHEAIAAHYRSELSSWQTALGVTAQELKKDLSAGLRSGAEGVVRLLPQRLKTDARWIAAGAVAGALGCVAAAALAAPAVIGALPVWTALGAAVAAVVRATTSVAKDQGSADQPLPSGRGDAVRAAALFALLLELQGRDEAAITRILDETVGDTEPPEIETAAAARGWLDEVRHRLDLALAGEAAS
ncbi:MAG: DUF2868 domain-containing protein [Planctomycetota bacterium]|jgi:hypothetical protein